MILSNNDGLSISPAITVSGSNVYVIWMDETAGNFEVFFRTSFDDGNSFGPTENLSNNAGSSSVPVVAVSGNNVYVAWYDDSTGSGTEILYRRSINNGASFGPIINLSNSEGGSDSPSMAASGNNLYVVWADGTSGNAEILYRRSTDGGANFGPTECLSRRW